MYFSLKHIFTLCKVIERIPVTSVKLFFCVYPGDTYSINYNS